MACAPEVQGSETLQGGNVFDEEVQKLKEFDAEKINSLPKIQVRGVAVKQQRHRHRMQVSSMKPSAPRARDLVAAAYAGRSSLNEFGVDKTNLLGVVDSAKISRKRLEKLPRYRI